MKPNMKNQRFKNKVVLVTGGSSGMGFASAKLFADEGADVVITGRSLEKLKSAAEKINSEKVLPVQGDVGDMNHLDTLAQKIQDTYGKLNILFANAGIGVFKPFLEITEADFDKLVDVNFKGLFFTIQKTTSLMEEGGSVIINASWTRYRGMGPSTVYSSTKAAVANLAQTVAAELASKNIRVNSISPGYVNTAQFNEEMLSEEEAQRRKNEVPLNRFGDAEEIAKAVVFLASQDASYINGEDILIDGGLVHVKN